MLSECIALLAPIYEWGLSSPSEKASRAGTLVFHNYFTFGLKWESKNSMIDLTLSKQQL